MSAFDAQIVSKELSNGRFWPLARIPAALSNVRLEGKNGYRHRQAEAGKFICGRSRPLLASIWSRVRPKELHHSWRRHERAK